MLVNYSIHTVCTYAQYLFICMHSMYTCVHMGKDMYTVCMYAQYLFICMHSMYTCVHMGKDMYTENTCMDTEWTYVHTHIISH